MAVRWWCRETKVAEGMVINCRISSILPVVVDGQSDGQKSHSDISPGLADRSVFEYFSIRFTQVWGTLPVIRRVELSTLEEWEAWNCELLMKCWYPEFKIFVHLYNQGHTFQSHVTTFWSSAYSFTVAPLLNGVLTAVFRFQIGFSWSFHLGTFFYFGRHKRERTFKKHFTEHKAIWFWNASLSAKDERFL